MEKLKEILKNEPKYRIDQVKKALFCDLISDWEQALALPKFLREKLAQEFSLYIKAKIFESKDGNSIRALITFEDGQKVESVLMRHQDKTQKANSSKGKGRNTVCVSSQVGCKLGCVFCATGKLGFKRNLTSWEVVEQVLFFARLLKNNDESVNNIVFMGMGEPFLNYDNVIGAIKILNDKEGFNLGIRHFSISTAGIIEGIEKLAGEDMQVNLAISLHAPNNKLRSQLMPINKKYKIEEVLKAVDKYIEKTNRRVMLEYIMIKGVNDSDGCALELSEIARRPLCFVNLISYNPTGIFEPPSPERVKKFKQILEKRGVEATWRHKFGEKTNSACGQLAGK